MSGGIGGGAPVLTFADFARMYAPTALPQGSPVQGSSLAALGQAAQYTQPGQGGGQGGGAAGGQRQGQGQSGGPLPFLGQLAQLGASGGQPGQGGAPMAAPAGQGGLQQLLINAMNSNGANGNSNALANAVGFTPFGTGSFG